MANNLSKLDAFQVLRSVYDTPNNALRVSVVDGTTGDGAGFEVIINHTDDSIRLGNGTDFFTSTYSSGKVALDVNIINPSSGSGSATEAKQDVGNASLASIDSKTPTGLTVVANRLIVDGSQVTQPVSATSLPLPTNAATETTLNALNDKVVNVDTDNVTIVSSVLPTGAATETTLLAIESKIPDLGQATMANSLPVVISSDQTPLSVVASLADEPVKMSGTENGQPNGTEFTFVNNVRQQILAAKDRVQNISYADFGTKDQRITSITYVASSIGSGAGYTAIKTFNYTLVGTRYRRDSIVWTLI